MKKFAVLLSGCGHMDGSEIHEATMTLWAINKNGCDYHCFAPNINQHHVVNHITGEEMVGDRNVLVEASRIARGRISDIKSYKTEDYDGLIIPGGFGAAKNLSNYAFVGSDCDVLETVSIAITQTHNANKPIGALCIAPVLLAKLIPSCLITVGSDQGTIANLSSLGADHKVTTHGEVVIDQINKLVTTPCYMLDARIDQIADGTDMLIKEILKFD